MNDGRFKKGQLPWNTGTKGLLTGFWKGKKLSVEHKKKLSKSHKGKPSWRKGKKFPESSGPNHPNWKGEKVSYVNLHAWVSRHRGKPSLCAYCQTTTAKKFEWANISGAYKRVLSDYIRLCTSCHRLYDYGKIKL